MRTNCYFLDLNDATANVIRLIALTVPCFISLEASKDETYGAYTIEAREEDWAWIESKLAPII